MKPPTPEQQANDTVAMFTAMAKEGGGPVYAQQIQYGTGPNGEPFTWFSMGMTKRERIAMAAMQGLISCWEAQQKICDTDPRYQQKPDGQYNFADVVATNAVEFADALLERLKK